MFPQIQEVAGWTQLGGVQKVRWSHVYPVLSSDSEGIPLIQIIARARAPMQL